jgi:hypothetical protein
MEYQYQGVVAVWLEKRNFGSLFSDETGRRFFHIKHWHRATPPVVGEAVSFNLKPSAIEGQPEKAIDVTPQNKITPGIAALASQKFAGSGGAE